MKSLYEQFGGRDACHRLATAFYARVARDPVLRPLFPGKTFTCAIEEFAAYLAQFLDGPAEDAKRRWWLSLRESHRRFQIGEAERAAWLRNMASALEESELSPDHRQQLGSLFDSASAYLVNSKEPPQVAPELASRWKAQQLLDEAVARFREGRMEEPQGRELIAWFAQNRSLYANYLGELLSNPCADNFVFQSLTDDPGLSLQRYNGKTLLHAAAAAGSSRIVELLLNQSADPNAQDQGKHTPLYSLANECSIGGADAARLLVERGADVDACAGVQRCTPLHMAARRGHVAIGEALLDLGANVEARDRNGDTPLQRALNCRKAEFAEMLRQREAR